MGTIELSMIFIGAWVVGGPGAWSVIAWLTRNREPTDDDSDVDEDNGGDGGGGSAERDQ